MRILILFSIFSLALFGCSKTSEDKANATVETSLLPPPPKEETMEAAAMEVYDSAAAAVTETENTLQPKIIKTGNLRFESDNLDQSFTAVQQALTKHKATIQNDESGKNYE